jgi:hypothetical protein
MMGVWETSWMGIGSVECRLRVRLYPALLISRERLIQAKDLLVLPVGPVCLTYQIPLISLSPFRLSSPLNRHATYEWSP